MTGPDPEKEVKENDGQEEPEEPEEPDVSSEQLRGDDDGGESGVDQGAGPGDSGEVPPTEELGAERTDDAIGRGKVGEQSGSNPSGLYEDANGRTRPSGKGTETDVSHKPTVRASSDEEILK